MNKIVIIGGVTGGATAAGRVRRQSPEAEIIMFEREPNISFANCGLPYYIGGVVEEKEALLITTPEKFALKYNIDVRVNSEVVSIDTDLKKVTVKNLLTLEEYAESYDKLLIATGAEPNKAGFPGAELGGVDFLRSYQDTLRIKKFIDEKKPKSCVVIGAGFIAMEMLDSLAQRNMKLTLIYRGEEIFSQVDRDMAEIIKKHLLTKGIELIGNSNVEKIEKRNEQLVVTTDLQKEISGDMVFLAIGSHPESWLAKNAGLKLEENGSIWVDEHLETTAKGVYAVGDAINSPMLVTGKKMNLALAGPAQQQARIVADNMVRGNHKAYKGVSGSGILKIFDLNVAFTGINSTQAQKEKIDFDSVTISSVSSAGYYPGSEAFDMKVLFEKPTGRILGCQILGGTGVDKRCDVIATAIYAGLTAWDLEKLQLCYAPPFSIPRDGVNIVGGLIVDQLDKSL